ncbi:neural cell adhesion molecule 2-like isoform X3 [Ciona intestinalis]
MLWLLIAALASVVSGQFTIQPDNAKGTIANKDLLMTCQYPSYFKSVRWLGLDKQAITNMTKGVKLDKDGRRGELYLTLVNVSSDMNGMYTCEGYDTAINQTVAETRIVTVFEPIGFVNPKTEQTFELGQTVSVICQVSGNPPPTVVWKQGTQSLEGTPENSRIYQDLDTNNLIIKNITKKDEGKYTCLARELSKGQTSGLLIFVDVQFGPAGIQVPKMVTGVQGGDVTLTCNATGEPEPMYKWYFGDGMTFTNTTLVKDGVSVDGKVLRVSNVTADDAGKYTCIAKNIHGTDSDTTDVIINVPPTISIIMGDSVVEGDDARIGCSATGIPPPVVTIFRHGVALNSSQLSETTPMTVEYNSGEAQIRFNPSSYADSGDYTCIASNSAGTIEGVIKLDIQYAPRETTLPEVYACLNEKAELSCIFDANPKPTLTWGKMLPVVADENFLAVFTSNESVGVTPDEAEVTMTFTPIVPDDNLSVQDQGGVLMLKISEVNEESYGKYYCRASNDHGEQTAVGELMMAMKSSKPLNVEVVDTSTSQANVIFSPPSNIVSQISRYLISLSSGSELVVEDEIAAGGDGNIEGRVLKYSFGGLTHDTEYTFTVAAENCQGVGTTSDPVSFTTEIITEPSIVNIESDSLGKMSTSYALKWSDLGAGGGKIKNMEISYKQVYDPVIGSNKNMTAPQPITIQLEPTDKEFVDKEYLIMDLDESTEYEVSINITNEVGSKTTLFVFTTRAVKKPNERFFDHENDKFNEKSIQAPTVPSTTADEEGTKLATGATNFLIIGIVIAAILLLLIIIDISCCISRHCGLTYLIWSSTCGASSKDSMEVKEGDVEEGSAEYSKDNKADDITKVGNTEKQPLDDAPVPNGTTSQPTEETPLQPVVTPKVTENVVTENGDNGSDVKASLMQNEQPTPANSPLDGVAEPKDVIKPDDVAVAVDNQASTVEETHA